MASLVCELIVRLDKPNVTSLGENWLLFMMLLNIGFSKSSGFRFLWRLTTSLVSSLVRMSRKPKPQLDEVD